MRSHGIPHSARIAVRRQPGQKRCDLFEASGGSVHEFARGIDELWHVNSRAAAFEQGNFRRLPLDQHRRDHEQVVHDDARDLEDKHQQGYATEEELLRVSGENVGQVGLDGGPFDVCFELSVERLDRQSH